MFWANRNTDSVKVQGSNRGRGWASLLHIRQQPLTPVEPLAVKAGVIGRPHAGKTAMFRALYRGTVQDNLPSKLQIDVDSPVATAKMIKETRATEAGLHLRGLPPTLERERVEFRLFEGDATRAIFHFNEVIGQVLVNPDGSEQQKKLYAEYVADLSDGDVLWVVVPSPPHEATQEDLVRYEDDLRLASAYLRAAVRLRRTARPCSTAIILTKLDSVFSSEEEAKSQLTDDRLIELLQPLVTMTLASDRTANAAIFPISSFGWQTAIVKPADTNGQDDDGNAPSALDVGTIDHGEREWILKRGVSPRPYGLTKLVVWSLLAGLLYQDVEVADGEEHPLQRACKNLATDVKAVGGWAVPVKGTLLSK
jgi:GTPase SAR1 family protein